VNKKLRLSHVKEGEESIKERCEEYVDIFKLQGDKLTATTAATHPIPHSSLHKRSSNHIKNYRLAETQKSE
jgi:hypothetical protein